MSHECGGDYARSRWELGVCQRESVDAYGKGRISLSGRQQQIGFKARAHFCARHVALRVTYFRTHFDSNYSKWESRSCSSGRARADRAVRSARSNSPTWVAKTPQEIGAFVDFIGALDPGNFHISCASNLFVVQPEVVGRNALYPPLRAALLVRTCGSSQA